jgi:hypothetical protein
VKQTRADFESKMAPSLFQQALTAIKIKAATLSSLAAASTLHIHAQESCSYTGLRAFHFFCTDISVKTISKHL